MYNLLYIIRQYQVLCISKLDELRLPKYRTMEMSSHFNTTFSVRHVLILRMCQGTKISSFAQVKFHHMVVVGGKSRALAVTNLKERGKKKKEENYLVNLLLTRKEWRPKLATRQKKKKIFIDQQQMVRIVIYFKYYFQKATSEKWQCQRSPWSLPLKFNNLNICSLTKDSLLNAQICLRDLLIETYKGNKWNKRGR